MRIDQTNNFHYVNKSQVDTHNKLQANITVLRRKTRPENIIGQNITSKLDISISNIEYEAVSSSDTPLGPPLSKGPQTPISTRTTGARDT